MGKLHFYWIWADGDYEETLPFFISSTVTDDVDGLKDWKTPLNFMACGVLATAVF